MIIPDRAKTLNVSLYIPPGSTEQFVSILQSGIAIWAQAGESIGTILEKLPGFTSDYIAEEVQTIFLNGTAVDDVDEAIHADLSVLSISAAMPGLSGAIFRRNGIHKNLRAVTGNGNFPLPEIEQEPITVILKFFNTIARDKGVALLQNGITIQRRKWLKFLKSYNWLHQNIENIECGDWCSSRCKSEPKQFFAQLADVEWLHISFIEQHSIKIFE